MSTRRQRLSGTGAASKPRQLPYPFRDRMYRAWVNEHLTGRSAKRRGPKSKYATDRELEIHTTFHTLRKEFGGNVHGARLKAIKRTGNKYGLCERRVEQIVRRIDDLMETRAEASAVSVELTGGDIEGWRDFYE